MRNDATASIIVSISSFLSIYYILSLIFPLIWAI